MAQFSLSWGDYKQNICSGLSVLQQNGEFVDMTLAADGHHVKVHQMVMSLVSPYIKELISSASCPHPVIFLNKISYPVLCAILEYIYTGEVMVDRENLQALVDAGKELRIKGLEDMKLELSVCPLSSQAMVAKHNEGQPLSASAHFKDTEKADSQQFPVLRAKKEQLSNTEETYIGGESFDDHDHSYDAMDTEHDDTVFSADNIITTKIKPTYSTKKSEIKAVDTQIQYTLSNQGALQMILNRYMYNLRYTSRKNGHRKWCCVDKRDKKCPATVVTSDDIVVQRFLAHSHPFHDHRILKKVRDNAVYSALNVAEAVGQTKKQQRATAKDDNVTKPNTDEIL